MNRSSPCREQFTSHPVAQSSVEDAPGRCEYKKRVSFPGPHLDLLRGLEATSLPVSFIPWGSIKRQALACEEYLNPWDWKFPLLRGMSIADPMIANVKGPTEDQRRSEPKTKLNGR